MGKYGKFCNVHIGIPSVSCSSPSLYVRVLNGKIISELHLVPCVPLSNSGLLCNKHLLSVYLRACTLSNAFQHKSKLSQNSSSNISSVSSHTFCSNASTLKPGFISLALCAAVNDFAL